MRSFKYIIAALCAAGCFNHAFAGDAHPGTGKVSYGFIENKGQVTDQYFHKNNTVAYLLPAPGLNVQLRKNGFSYDTYVAEYTETPAAAGSMASTRQHPDVSYRFHRIDITLEGSNAGCKMVTEGRSADFINYYTAGTDDGVLDVHHYSKVTYRDIYNGIDLEFVTGPGTDKPFEYNFIVHPGADAGQIRLRYEGADNASLKDGKLKLAVNQGELSERIPASFIASTKQPVTVTYAQYGTNIFGYSVQQYDRSQTLIIDPTPDRSWSTYYGGSNWDGSAGIGLAVGGLLYFGGTTQSSGSIATFGAYQGAYGGNWDGYLAEFTTYGIIIGATYYGGTGEDDVNAIVVNPVNGDTYIAGNTASASGISTIGSHQAAYGGGAFDGFVAKFNGNGVRQWGTYYGGSSDDRIMSITVDTFGNVYFTGNTQSATGIATPGSTQPAIAGGQDGFLAKFNSSGVRQWATYAGDANNDAAMGVTTDPAGNVFMSGAASFTFAASNLVTTGAHQTTFGGTSDYFLEKYNASGVRQWGTYYGGSQEEYNGYRHNIAADTGGNVYLTGATASANNIATTGSYLPTFSGTAWDGFIAKFNGNGIRQWATYYGSTTGSTELISIAADYPGNIYVTGDTRAATGLATPNAYQTSRSGTSFYEDACIAKFNSAGNILWSTYYGDNNSDIGYDIGVDEYNRVFVAGETYSAFGMGSTGAHQVINAGSEDAFIARFFECGNITGTTSTDTACFGKPNGQITVETIDNGEPPFQYKLGSGSFQSSYIFGSLAAGSYTITISDDDGCTGTVSATVAQYAPIAAPAVTGKTTVQKGETVTYSTPAQTGISFNWAVTGGSITSGQATAQVQVLWGANGTGSVKVVATSTAPCADSVTSAITINPATSVTDIYSNTLQVYPNPNHGSFEIEGILNNAGDIHITVYNAIGQLVYSDKAAAPGGAFQKTYNLSHLQPGVYTLTLSTASEKQNIRLVLE